MNTVKNKKGNLVVMNRAGALVIHDQKGRERERPRRRLRRQAEGEGRPGSGAGQLLVEWDPHSVAILTVRRPHRLPILTLHGGHERTAAQPSTLIAGAWAGFAVPFPRLEAQALDSTRRMGAQSAPRGE